MWLINVDTRLLEEFLGERIPSYAILSHTWGEPKDEVLFMDIGERGRFDKHGYRKIEFLCDQAARDRLSYAWCDTCCINKWSSSELSESINSMFKWYQDAKVCYAYLEDLPRKGDSRRIVDQLEDSRWFTRGWTLQELLAPKRLTFYDRNWNYVGDKRSLIYKLYQFTRINFGALNFPQTVSSYSIAARMSWAAHRATTRPEDQAYCMLGILNVNIPLLYGEGQAAFRRLQEELIRTSDDETIFAHSGRGPGILAHSIKDFHKGKPLTVLPMQVPTPFAITNAGLSIHMRIVDLRMKATAMNKAAVDDGVSAIGILNCHDNGEELREGYLGLPLEDTWMDNTYRRAPGNPRWIAFHRASKLPHRTIFIQLRPLQISRITLLEKFNKSEFHCRGNSVTSEIVYNESYREYRIYPAAPYELEVISHVLHWGAYRFTFVTVFELVFLRAGVLLSSDEYDEDGEKLHNRPDAILKRWREQDRPTSVHVNVSPIKTGSKLSLRISVDQGTQIKQFFWNLRIERVEEEAEIQVGRSRS